LNVNAISTVFIDRYEDNDRLIYTALYIHYAVPSHSWIVWIYVTELNRSE